MSKKIFKYIMLVSSLITVLGLAFVVGILYHYFQGQLMGELKKEAVYISRGVESTGIDYLKKLNDEDSRITYVDESGKVIYDNEANVESMDNHGHRKEIREAEINGEGADERMSSTLSEKTMYYAVRLENGNVLRVSSNQASVWMLLLQLLPPFAAVLILMLLLSGVFASRLPGRLWNLLMGLIWRIRMRMMPMMRYSRFSARLADRAGRSVCSLRQPEDSRKNFLLSRRTCRRDFL